ncbi:MAG: rhodanese-like domain-containing protein [Crocinitomicaceae bacterium]
MENLNQVQWLEKIQNDSEAVILDVRSPQECAEGMQANAIQMNIMNTAQFIADINTLDKSKNYYVYCRSGGRSGQACMLMGAKGYITFNLNGGMLSWTGEVVMP